MPGTEFSGNYSHNIDPKGRVTIPSAYREALGGGFTIGMNNEFKAIALYPAEKWADMCARMDAIPESDVVGTAYVRLIRAFSFSDQSLDGQGRVLLPAVLRDRAGMDKAIRFVGMGRYLEIWDDARFVQVNEAAVMDFSAMLAHVNSTYFSPQK